MSVTAILANAVSGLNASQIALRNTSTNVANVNNVDYARRVVSFESRTLGGVDVSEIRRIADEFLSREGLSAAAALGAADSIAAIHDRLQSIFGNPNSASSIPGLLDGMFAAVAELQIDPTSVVRRATALNGIQQLLGEFDRVGQSVQQARLEADRAIAGRVGEINALIKDIYTLNNQIAGGEGRGADVNALIDQRQKSLGALSQLIDVRVSMQPGGQAHIATTDGTFLVGNSATELHYDPTGAVTSDTLFARLTLHVIGQGSGVANPVGQPFEPHLAAGELRGLLDMRDVTLPKIAQEIGELADGIADQLNRVHSDNSAVPAPNQLVGVNTGLLGADAHNFTGVVNFSVVDPGGLTVTTVRADFTAGQYRVNGGPAVAFAGSDINSIVAGINTGLGASGTLGFAGGVMRLSAANPANGVAMLQDPASPSARAGRGFAHFFGLNDLVAANAPSHYDTGLSAVDAHGFGAGQTLRMKFVNPLGQVAADYTLTIGGATIGDILNQLNDPVTGMGARLTFSLDANGALQQTPKPGYENFKLFSIDDQTSRGGTATSLSRLFGIGPGARDLRAIGMQVRADIAANSQRLGLAKLDITAPGAAALGKSDDRGALALHALQEFSVAFAQAGHLSGVTLTLADYTGQLLGNAAQLAGHAANARLHTEAIKAEIDAQISSVSGVNLDEEMANLVVYQNSYNAAARLIKAAQELLDTLLAVI